MLFARSAARRNATQLGVTKFMDRNILPINDLHSLAIRASDQLVNVGEIALLRLVRPCAVPWDGSEARRCATGGHVGLRGPASDRAWMKIPGLPVGNQLHRLTSTV